MRYLPNQSNAKLTAIATWLPAFSRAGHKSRVLTLNSHWFLWILPFPLVGRLWLLWFFLLDALSKIALVEFYPLVVEIIKKKKTVCSSWRTLCSMLIQNIFETLCPKKKTNLRWPAWKSFIEDSQLWSFRRQVSSFREESEERVAELLGATESFLFRRATGQRSKMVNGHLIELRRGVGSLSHSILFLWHPWHDMALSRSCFFCGTLIWGLFW